MSRLKKFARSFLYAAEGIIYIAKTQRNFRFHIVAVVWVLLFSLFYNFSGGDYALLLLTFSSVMAAEAVNTAVEKTVDLCTDKVEKLAKYAKDAAAGAVLITAAFAVGVAVCLFADMDAIRSIGEFALKYPIADVGTVLLAAVSVLFVFYN